jgi:hypothetical protein
LKKKKKKEENKRNVMIGNTRSIPIVCFSVQNQAKKKRNLQTGYIEQMIDFE